MKVETDNWKEFRVGDLFDIHPTTSYKYSNRELFDGGDNPVIVNSAYNNGVGGYTSLEITEQGNIITFSDTVDANTIFYQEYSFVGYSHVQGVYPKDPYKELWNKECMLFFVSVFRKSAFSKGFNYGNKFRRDIAVKLKVKLPCKIDGTPDFEYMEKYVSNMTKKVKRSFNILQETVNKKSPAIDTTKWKKFHLYNENLFDIDSGSKLDKLKMTSDNPSILFIGRSSANNGITSKVDRIEGIEPYKAGYLTLSLGGEYLGSCFIQEDYFYTSQNVAVLIPKKEMSFLVKQFIATVIFKETQLRYKAFIDELNRHIKTDFSFYLPCNPDGTPDFAYMEAYIQGLQEKVSNRLNMLASIIQDS